MEQKVEAHSSPGIPTHQRVQKSKTHRNQDVGVLKHGVSRQHLRAVCWHVVVRKLCRRGEDHDHGCLPHKHKDGERIAYEQALMRMDGLVLPHHHWLDAVSLYMWRSQVATALSYSIFSCVLWSCFKLTNGIKCRVRAPSET